MTITPDARFGQVKVNGLTFADESLTYSMDFWTVQTSVPLTASVGTLTGSFSAGQFGSGSAVATTSLDATGELAFTAPEESLNKLVEIISLNGQPVILYAPVVSTTTTNAAGSTVGATYVWSLSFAIEHAGSWGGSYGGYGTGTGSASLAQATMVAAIGAAGIGYGFNTDAFLTATLTNTITPV